jgi:two-component system, chemotaxis family, protein-glutamate methylesterase/glutaminase
VKSCGGTTVVQDPAEAAVPEMPANASAVMKVDHCLPVEGIAALITALARTRVTGDGRRPARVGAELDSANPETSSVHMEAMDALGKPTTFTCPTCRGALWQMEDGGLRYRCHTGHAFSKESMLAEQSEAAEQALYSALATVEERSALLRHIAGAHRGSPDQLEASFHGRAERLDETATVLRQLLARPGSS